MMSSMFFNSAQNKYHDLSPHVVRRRPSVDARPTWQRRVALYGLAVAVAGSLFVWSTTQAEAIETSATLDQTQASQSVQHSLIEALVASQTSAMTLADRGVALLRSEGRTADASLYLSAAAAKDPQFRDAALYAGLAELQLADGYWTNNGVAARRHTKTALTYLELARAIDPIHPSTFELLEIAYTNLGQQELAAEASEKALAFGEQPNS